MLAACSSESTIEEVKNITESTDPMRFTGSGVSEEVEIPTRASAPLTTGFMVSCWKAYGIASQQDVMEKYRVEYKVDGWSNKSSWNYVGVNGQYEKYWDYSNFPYRFHAIAPSPANPNNFILKDNKLTISATYKSQTCHNGTITNPDAEPYLLAQVQRNTDGSDHDIFAGKEIGNGSTTKNREVALPFHHLNSKVRFGVYTTDYWATDNKLYIEGLTIKVTSPDFATEATSYTTTGTNSWMIDNGYSGFAGLTKTTNFQLLQFDGGPALTGNDLRVCQGRSSAYMLQCPDGIMQLPQENIKMAVSFNLMKEGSSTPYKTYTDVPIKLEDNTEIFQWHTGYIHTYYLILGPFDKLSLNFTATLTPWEDINGSLSTDLEK